MIAVRIATHKELGPEEAQRQASAQALALAEEAVKTMEEPAASKLVDKCMLLPVQLEIQLSSVWRAFCLWEE